MTKPVKLPVTLNDAYGEPKKLIMPKGNSYVFWLRPLEIEINYLGNCKFVACDEQDNVLGAFESVSDAFVQLIIKGYNVEFGLKLKLKQAGQYVPPEIY